MKRVKGFFLTGAVLLLTGQPLFAQSKQAEKERKAQAVKEQVSNDRWTIDVRRAIPLRGGSVNLTSSYTLEMRGDSVIAYLPYFGRAYSVPYGGGGGLQFEEPLTERRLTYDKKGTAQLTFETRADQEQYTFDVRIYPNGSATIHVQPVHKQSITYHGELIPAKQQEQPDRKG